MAGNRCRLCGVGTGESESVCIVHSRHARNRHYIRTILHFFLFTYITTSLHFSQSGEDCRAIILTGAGSVAFTSGLDITDPSLLQPDHDDDADADHAGEYTQNPDSDPDVARMGVAKLFPKIIAMQRCFTQIEKCPIPVIAAINGLCLGGGMDLASVCDVRICSEEAKFAVREVCVGLAADVGTLQRLPIITGNDSRVRELCYTGEIFTATEALELGFVSRICGAGRNSHGAQQHPNTTSTTTALMTEALALAIKIAANSPLAVMGTKRSLVYSRDHSVAEGLHHIATHNALALMTQDIPLAIRSSSKNGGKGIASNKRMMPKFTRIPKFSKL